MFVIKSRKKTFLSVVWPFFLELWRGRWQMALLFFSFSFSFKILFIYSTEIETARERGNTSRGSGRGRSRLIAEEPDVGFDPITAGSCPEPKADP